MKEKKGRSGLLVHSLLEKPRELLITIYIGNELVNIAISVLITSIAITLFGNIGVGIAIGASIPIALTWSVFDEVPLPLALALGALLVAWSAAIHWSRSDLVSRTAVGIVLVLLAYLTAIGPTEAISRYRSAKRTKALATQHSNNHYSEMHAIRRAKIIARYDQRPKQTGRSTAHPQHRLEECGRGAISEEPRIRWNAQPSIFDDEAYSPQRLINVARNELFLRGPTKAAPYSINVVVYVPS